MTGGVGDSAVAMPALGFSPPLYMKARRLPSGEMVWQPRQVPVSTLSGKTRSGALARSRMRMMSPLAMRQ